MKCEFSDIVVTGLAAISSAGVGLKSLQETMQSGACRLTPMPEEVVGETGHLWGKVAGFRVADFMPPLKARKFDRCSLLTVVAAGMAIKDAGIDLAGIDRTRIGIILGCGFGGVPNAGEFLHGYFTGGTEGLVPMLFPNTVPNAAASNASIEHGLKGPNVTHVQRFCSAESAFFMALRFLEEGRADMIIAGGADDVNPLILRGFRDMGQLRRYGADFAEGAGLLVLEKRDHAVARGAAIRAAVVGVRTVGHFPRGCEAEGLDRLLAGAQSPSLVCFSGTADRISSLTGRFPAARRLVPGRQLGRSLAMGGLAMVSLMLSLTSGEQGLHLAASPEGPYYAIDFLGGAPVQS